MRTPTHLLGLVALCGSLSAQVMATDVGIKDTRFTLNGVPTFLLGISYVRSTCASNGCLNNWMAKSAGCYRN